MTRRTWGCGLLLVAACGGGAASRPADPPATPGQCLAEPSVAATRRPKPADAGCMDRAAREARVAACNAADADACYLVASCELLDQLGAEPGAARTAAVANVRQATRVACDGGIAEACTMRVGAVTSLGEPQPADACADLVRACQLAGDPTCFDCRQGGCD